MGNRRPPNNTISVELESLSRISSALISDLSLEKVLDITVKEMRRIFGIRVCGIFLPDEKGILKLNKSSGVQDEFQEYFNQNINARINRSILGMLVPRYTNDVPSFYGNMKFLHALVRIGKFKKEISVPLKLKHQIIGVLNIGRYAQERDFTAHDLALVNIFANHVAIAINNAQLYKKLVDHAHTLAEQNKDLNTILDVSQSISHTLELDRILKVATKAIAKALRAGRCTATLGTPTEGVGVLRGIYPDDKKGTFPIGARFYLKDVPFLRKSVKDRKYLFVPDINELPISGSMKEHFRKSETRSALFIPFVVAKQIMGVFTISSLSKPRIFSPSEIKLAQTIANQVAVAIENARLMDLVREHSHHLSLLSAKVIRTQEDERKKIAGELHDRVGQALTAMKINLEMSRRGLLNHQKEIKNRLLDTQQLLTETLEGIRHLSLDLRPTLLDDFGLVPTLRWYGESFSKRFSIKFNLKSNIHKRFSAEIETVMYRAAQEALTNVARHSRAKKVWLSLCCSNSDACLNIRDNGIGFDANALYDGVSRDNLGLVTMKERVELLKGNFSIKSNINAGTKLTIKIPVKRSGKN